MDTRILMIFVCLLCFSTLVIAQSGHQVTIPEDCADACPPDHDNKICARNTVTGKLGSFESECVFGRYQSCVKTTQKYEFVKYGEC